MKQSTFSAQMANNLLTVLQGYSKTIRLLLVMFLTLTVTTNAWAETETITANDATYANSTHTWSQTSCTVVQSKGNASSAVNSSFPDRWYQGHKIAFTPKSGYTITKIVLVGSSEKYNGQPMTASVGTIQSSSNTTTWDGNITSSSSVTLTMGKQFRFGSVTITYTAGGGGSTPTLTVDKTSLAFGNVATDSNKEMTFTLTGSDLTANATLALSGADASKFSVSPTSVTQSAGSINQTITVTYTPTATGSHNATLTISSTGAESKTVALSGTGTAPAAKYTVTFDAGSGTCGTESLTETSGGAGVTLPTANPPAACATDGWEFAGWWTEAVTETTTSPGELLTADSNYKPTSNCTLYAVYSYTEAGGGGSGFYLSVTKDATTYYIGEKGSGSFLSAVTDVNSAATFNIENNQYLYYGNKTYVSSTANSTSLTIATTTPSATWAITDEGETITFKSNGTGGRYLAFNYNNGSPRFSSYGSTYTYELTKHTTSTTTYNSNPDCGSTGPSQLATPTGLNVTNLTSTSATLSWGEVANASSYTVFITDLDDEEITLTDIEEASVDVTGLSPETLYLWDVVAIGDGANYTDSEHSSQEDPNAEFTTQEACTDAVTISKGTETNGTFTLSTTGQQSTCNGSVTVTLSDIEPATGYQFSAITQTGINSGVTIDNTAKTVTYAKNTTGNSTIDVTFTPKEYTLSLESTLNCVDNGSVTIEYNATSAKTFTAATRDDYTCTGYWSAPSGGVQVLKADGTFVGDVSGFISGGKWINTTATKLTPRWETEYKMILSKGTEENGTYTLSTTNIETSECATSTTRQVTITATPDAGYEVDQITYSGAGTATQKSGPTLGAGKTTWVYTFAENNKGTGTFTVTFKSLPKYTISFSTGTGNPTQADIAETTANAGITLPAGPTPACTDWTFAGWAEASVEETTTVPTLLSQGDNYKPTADITLYAVYSKEETEEGGGTTPTEATLSFESTAQRTSFSSTQQVWEQNGITLTNNKHESTSNVADYANPARFYAGSQIIINAPGNISKIVATCAENKHATALKNSAESNASAETSNLEVTITPNDANATYYTIAELTAQVQMNSITVTYITAGGGGTTYYNSNPICEVCENIITINKGTETNGTFTLDISGDMETCDGDVVVTVSDIQPVDHYSVQSVTATTPTTGGEPTVTDKGDGTYTVTYAQNSKGESTINVTFVEDAKASITLYELGVTTTDNTTYYVGEEYTLPNTSSQSCDGKELVGWSTVEVAETDTKPTENYYELGAEVTLAATQTFYAVFATPGEGGVDNTDYSNVHTSNVTLTNAGGTNATNSKVKISEVDYTAVKAGTGSASGAVKITVPAGTTKLSFHMAGWNGEGGKTISLSGATADPSSFKTVADAGVSGSSTTYTLSGTIADYFYSTTLSNIDAETTLTFSNGGADQRFVIWGVNASTGGAVSYSEYTTVCEAIPDPVWGGAVINSNSIKVDCGSMTKLNAADPNGPATISFPAATNHTLTYDITVTASERFLVSTNKTDAAKYGESVTVSPNKTGDNAGKITQNVYVVAVAPAMSDEDFTGTITLSGKQLAEPQVIDVTADVTCTTYTLTLDDRGTKTTAEYYAGASVPKPADPEGVCTDPINYVFDGWSLTEVTAADATSYDKVTFPFEMPADKKTLYAVYRYVEEGSGDSGDYVKVTDDLDDYSGDYLFVYETGNVAFDGGRNNVDDELDATSNTIGVTINGNTIASNATTDAAKFTIAKVDGGYSIQSASGYYIGWGGEKNGLNTNSSYTVNYRNTISDNTICGKTGYLKYNKTADQKRFRYYQSGQEAIALYRKAASYLYTTSPVCGPHLVVTEGKDIYVTGGNAGGTRDLVIAQQKVSYKATRLQTSNGLVDGTAPDVKVATNGITVGGVVTSDVKVTIDQTKEQQTDGTYTITGTITVQYQPSANNKQEDIQVQLAVDYNAEARDNFTVHARSLPSEFVIVAKSGDKWYALNGDMNTNAANPANGQVTLDNDDNPTKATYAPCNTIYTFDGLPNTGDRTYVRFQGTDGAWLWASSGTNVGIQNNVLKTTPEGNNNAYNWKLYTQDNITYQFGNANSNRQLTLSDEKFGMYASGVQDIRILPYVEKCLYNYAPSNLKVSVLKGTYVTLTWDAVVGATKYQYSTNGTTWMDAGTEPSVTISGLTGDTEYIYYIRAYHEDTGVSQECIDYAEITFTTANCDDVPTDITYSADMTSIIVSWIANAATSTVNLYSDEEAEVLVATQSVASPCTFTDLAKNTQYYVQILANGTCASPIIPVKTEDVEVDIVEWMTDGIIVDINTDETIGVTLENEVSYGSGLGTEATELFFSKYYEASYNVKLVAIYNGTKNIIDLTDYTIQYGKTSWETNYITLKDFGATKGQIQPGEEIILYSMQDDTQDDEIMDCVHEDFPDGNWVRVTSSNNDGKGTLSFGGDKTIILCKTEYDDETDEYYDNIIDVIGALKDDPNEGILPTNENTEKPSWGDKEGWVCETGLSIADDSQIGISTNRCLLIRNNTVTSGDNAVASNMNNFVTLCSEWKGAHVPDDLIDNGVQASCDNFAYVGTFDYSDYYTKYESMGEGTTFEDNDRNLDGTVTIPITDLYKHACSNIRVKLTNSNGDVLTDREYKVPIMITSKQTTAGQTFLDLQQNLATKEVDGEGNVINTYPLSLDEVREICKTCDVVIRDNATLTKASDDDTNDHPQVNNVMIYEGASLEIPSGVDYNYIINSLSLRRKGDDVASAKVEEGGNLSLPVSATAPIYLDMRIDANNWHWFTLPYNCNIADVTWVDGTPAQYNKDWFIMYYDGNSRAHEESIYENHWKVYNGTTIEAGKGYIVGIQGDITHPDYTFELRFPMSADVLTRENEEKSVPLYAWGVDMDITPNKKGWNLVGNPYLDYYKTSENISFKGLSLIKYGGIDSVTGDRLYDDSGNIPFLVSPVDGGWYEYQQELASDVEMMPFTAYFVQVGDPANASHTDGMELHAEFVSDNRGRISLIRRAPQEVDGEQEPVIVRVEVANAKGESDKTTLIIDDRFTNEYEMNGDFFKWFGDYYRRYTKPVLYSMGADHGKRAFNALSEQLAAQPVALGMFAAQAGDYTFSLTRKRCDLSRVEEVWLYDATTATYTNLMQQDYTFTTAKTEGEGRFYLSVKMRQNAPTDITDIYGGNIIATAKDGQIIVSGLTDNTQLWIYDATGKLLHTEQTTNFQHVYEAPVAGTYFVRTQGAGQAQTIKVLVE